MATIRDGDNVKSAQDIIGDGQVSVDKFYTTIDGKRGIDNVINKEILVTGFEERTSSFRDGPGVFYTIVAKAKVGKNVKTIGFNTGSTPLIRELDQLKEHLPIKVKIYKVKAKSGFYYYTMQNRKASN